MHRFEEIVAEVCLGVLCASSAAAGIELCDLGKLVAVSPGAGDDFGRRVDISGDTAVVGSWEDDAPTNSGSVTVFRYIRGAWMVEQTLVAPVPASGDRFGAAVALEGDVLIVGAPEDDDFGSNAGLAYVFHRADGVWALETTLKNESPAANDQFGWSLALSGETLAVGARLDDEPATNTGAVVVFLRSEAGVWTQQAKFKGVDTAASDQFGYSVALHDDTLVVGAFNDDDGGIDSGGAFVFMRSDGVWSQQAKLIPADLSPSDLYGSAVAVEADRAVVGSPQDDDGATDAGSAYVFERNGAAWGLEAKLAPKDPNAQERFGLAVAIDASRIVVGAPGDNSNAIGAGSVRLFLPGGGSWVLSQTFTAFDATMGLALGSGVDIDGDLILGGAEGATVEGLAGAGATYLFVATADDCNGNGTVDWCDVVQAGEEDCNSNGVPDQCEVIPPVGDVNLDCFVDGADLGLLLADWGPCAGCATDMNGDGVVNGADLGLMLAAWYQP
jgi:hypothetical protein